MRNEAHSHVDTTTTTATLDNKPLLTTRVVAPRFVCLGKHGTQTHPREPFLLVYYLLHFS